MKHKENVVRVKDLLNHKTFCNIYKAVYKSEYKEGKDSNVFAIHSPPGKKPKIQSKTNIPEYTFTLTKDVSMRKTTELEGNLALLIASHNLPIVNLENQFMPKIVGDSNAMIPSVDKMTKIIMPSIAHEIREKVTTTISNIKI
uniref:tRNA-synt_1c domain-containing protein n=1 Tax=Strongyloides venezuelensis TaxID=75913 RepID=A0A0K0F149_STRVS